MKVVFLVEEQKIISISIPQNMYDWLETHPEINRSNLFREVVLSRQQTIKHKVSPLVFLVSVMGVTFSVVLISLGLEAQSTFLNDSIRGLMCLLGGILAVSSSLVYYKERQKVRQ